MNLNSLRRGDVFLKEMGGQIYKYKILHIFKSEKVPQVVMKWYHKSEKRIKYIIIPFPCFKDAVEKRKFFKKGRV